MEKEYLKLNNVSLDWLDCSTEIVSSFETLLKAEHLSIISSDLVS